MSVIFRLKNSAVGVFKITKWCIRLILVLTGIVSMARCSSGYKEKDGKVTFNGEEITDKNFIVLNDVFAKDDSTAYYKRYRIDDADVATFTSLDRHYAKDKNLVFYCDEESEGQNYYLTKHSVIIKVKGAIPATFTILGDGHEGYAKDHKRGYFKGAGFDVKDVATLSVIEGQFTKDKYQVYFKQVPVKGADANSFRTIGNFYAKDTARVYYYGHHNELYNGIYEIPCSTASFTILDYPYAKDATSVFYFHTKINEADAASFSILGNDFSKDKNHVYFKTKIVKGADAASFKILPQDENARDGAYYSKDKDHAFWKEKMFSVKDIAAFKVLPLGYATDNKHIYFHTNMVKGADVATFKTEEHGYGDWDAEDARSKYLAGVKVME